MSGLTDSSHLDSSSLRAGTRTVPDQSSETPDEIVTGILYLLDDVKVDYHIAWVIDRGYSYVLEGNAPSIGNQIPLSRIICSKDGAKAYAFKTTSVSLSSLSQAGIAYPQVRGYRQLVKPQEVYLAKSGKITSDDDMADMMDQLGVGNGFGKGNPQRHATAPKGAK